MRRLALAALWAAAGLASACSSSGAGEARGRAAAPGDDAAAAVPVPVALTLRPLGGGRLADFDWRRGPGRAAFARALVAEKAGDLAGVAREASAALAADPGHLEAAWLVAVARARLGELDGVLAPLEIAAAGDWPKWGERSLDLAALAGFRATPAGRAWVEAGERYRAALADALAGALVVVARTAPASAPRLATDGVTRVDHRAELYAVDLAGGRWLRLTRTGGTVVGALPAPGRPLVAYAAYREVARARAGTSIRELRVGVVELGTGRAGREVALRDVHEVTLGWQVRGSETTLVARVVPARTGKGAAAPPRTYAIDWKQGQRRDTDLPPARDGLRIRPLTAERRRLPVRGVTADWDDAGTASAARIDKSKKVVVPVGGAMIDGHSLVWSPDGARLAFATAAEDPCAADAAARAVAIHVVDAASGRARVVGQGVGVPSPVWLDAARLAFVDGDGVRVVDVAASRELVRLEGGPGAAVVTAVFGESRACAAAGGAGPFAGLPDDAGGGGGSGDGGEPGDEGADVSALDDGGGDAGTVAPHRAP